MPFPAPSLLLTVPSTPAGAPSSDGAQTCGPASACGCGSTLPPTEHGQCPACGRWRAGNTAGLKFEPGNEVALVHGMRQLRDRLADEGSPLDQPARIELRDRVLADLGGSPEVSAVLAALVDDFAAAVVLRDFAFSHLAAVGPLTRAGRRRAVVDLYLQASARAERLGGQIGTARRQAQVPSLAEYLQRTAECPQEPGDDMSATRDSEDADRVSEADVADDSGTSAPEAGIRAGAEDGDER